MPSPRRAFTQVSYIQRALFRSVSNQLLCFLVRSSPGLSSRLLVAHTGMHVMCVPCTTSSDCTPLDCEHPIDVPSLTERAFSGIDLFLLTRFLTWYVASVAACSLRDAVRSCDALARPRGSWVA